MITIDIDPILIHLGPPGGSHWPAKSTDGDVL